jgi:hypothetical protein
VKTDSNGSAAAQDLMRAAPAAPSVLDACGAPGRRARLEAALRSLEACERALQDYLETKRRAFPRFYVVAPADLLDILARGADPHAVQQCVRLAPLLAGAWSPQGWLLQPRVCTHLILKTLFFSLPTRPPLQPPAQAV